MELDARQKMNGSKPHGHDSSMSEPKCLEHIMFEDIKPSANKGELVQGLIDFQSGVLLFGESNVGKSFIALDLAFNISLGRDWFGKKVKLGACVYVAAEAGRSIAKRIEALKKEHKLEGDRKSVV